MAKKIKFSSNPKAKNDKTTKNKKEKRPDSRDEKINKIDEFLKEKDKVPLEKTKQNQKEKRLKEREKKKLQKQKEKEAKKKAKQAEKLNLIKSKELEKQKKLDKKKQEEKKELEQKKVLKEKKEKEEQRLKEIKRKELEAKKKQEEKSKLNQEKEQQRKEKEKQKLNRHNEKEEKKKQKEAEKKRKKEEKLKAKQELQLAKEKEQEKKRKEKQKMLKQKEEERLKLEKEKQKEKERKAKELEKQRLEAKKQKDAQIKAEEERRLAIEKEQEKKKIEKMKEKEEKRKKEESKVEKSFFKSKKFDQSEIEIVKEHDETQENNPKIIDFESPVDSVKEGDIIYERKGYGYKGQGSRKIVFDDKTKQYMYLVSEPELSEEEEEIKEKLIHLFRIRADVDVFEVDINLKKQHLKEALESLLVKNKIDLSEQSKDKIFYYIFREFIGYGKIDIMMKDEVVEDISCDGHKIPIFIYHKDYENIKSNVLFENVEELTSFVIKLSQMCGKQISVYEPVVDGKLSDGSRLQTTLGKTITKHSTFTIRRFREDPLTPIDLIKNNTMSIEMAAYFWMTIENGASVLFCGGTASGKTTALNALSLFLPFSYKIVSVEDTREINLPHENWIAGTTRTGFSTSEQSKTGKDIDMFDLIRVALRQRPKAIIVGEVRGKEAYSLFQAMTTGHLSYSTVHASDMHSLIQRLESPPISLPRALLTSLDLVVFLNSLTIQGKPVRRITNVTEIIKLDPETNRLVTITPFSWMSEIDDRFKNSKGSQLINKIKLQNMWDDTRIEKEVKNRIKVLQWMIDNKIRSYKKVGETISEYYNDAKSVLKKIEDSK